MMVYEEQIFYVDNTQSAVQRSIYYPLNVVSKETLGTYLRTVNHTVSCVDRFNSDLALVNKMKFKYDRQRTAS